MRQIADFHIHSKYSRACSRDLNLENIEKTCRIKGIDIIGTGDFTYPDWFNSIKNELVDIGGINNSRGLYKLKQAQDDKIKFVLSSEVALIYKKNGKCRRVHMLIHAPDMESASELNRYLDKNYNIRSDGRPILGMSIEKLCGICFAINPKFLIYPAHIWTPWFAIFGSKSGFDSWEETFGEYADKIFAYETGLSSDPEMNWRVSDLDKFTLLSNSDAHSLTNLAREANVFELARLDYDTIYDAVFNGQRFKKDFSKRELSSETSELSSLFEKSFLNYTIEFYPEEGMYHYDGHRDCGFFCNGDETRKLKGICPKCKRTLTLGVDYRVAELADRPLGFRPKNKPGFKKLVGLDKIIAESLGIKSRTSKKVLTVYREISESLGSELEILLHKPTKDIGAVAGSRIAEGIERMRSGELTIKPGFDGQYGEVKIFNNKNGRIV